MSSLSPFVIAFLFSFVGSAPPGTLNLTIFQIALEGQLYKGLRFAAGAALVEYPYGWIAVKFGHLIATSEVALVNTKIVASLIMLILGIVGMLPVSKKKFVGKYSRSGFRRGIVLSVLNPFAIPYWTGITIYIKSLGWTALESNWQIHTYLLGISVGAFCFLVLLFLLARRLTKNYLESDMLRKFPAYLLIALGLYGLISVVI